MSLDIATTNYALSNGIGYEGNNLMSGVASNLYSLIIVKFIGSMVILMLMNKILQKNEKIAKIGIRLIIFMMLFVVGNNLLVIQASALSFSNLSFGGTGSINNGNGFFDNPSTTFGYSGTRNVYLLAEDTQINIIEPISFAAGSSNAYTLVNSSFGTIKDAVVHQGYVYFIDGTTLKKRSGHSDTSQCESNDTSAGGCITTISTGVDTPTLRVYNDNIYFIVGGVLKTLDSLDNVQNVFTIGGNPPGGGTAFSSFAITNNGSTLTAYLYRKSGVNTALMSCISSSCAVVYLTASNDIAAITTLYSTTNYIYFTWYCSGCGLNPSGETLIRISNGSLLSVNYATSDAIGIANRVYVGGQSTVGLVAQSTTTYETFNSNEVGIDSLPTVPLELVYQTATIESLETQYYNKSDIYLNYNVIISSLNANNILLDFNDYRWMISMTDPNGVTQDVIQSPACSFDSLLDTTCQVFSSMGIHAPPNGWLQGTWSAKLYEINIVTANRALVATSSSFTVLNTSLENQSIIPPPFIPPTSGTAPQAVTIIDGFVRWLGLGVNSVSKLLFAMIIIAIAATVGLIWGNGNVAMVFAFVPYAFFTFIDYIPKWIFIIAIILITIASRAFR